MTTTINKEQKNPNVPNLRFPEFEGEWKRTSLKDISTVNPKSASLEESFVYIDLEAVEKGILKKQQTILRSEAPSRAQRVIMDGDILFQCVRPYQKNNYLHKGQNNDKTQWVASTGYAQIRTTESPSYLYHTLNTDGFNKKVMVRCTGSSYPAINSDDLSTIHFYFSPQKEEQRKISQLFDLLDERIATQNKIIEDLKKLKCAIAERLFNVTDGDSVPLTEVCTILKGKQINSEFLSEKGKYYVMNGGTEPSGYYDKSNAPADTISISEGGNSCGYIQYNREAFWSGGHCYTLNNITPNVCKLYLYHNLKSQESSIMKLRIGTGLPNIQKKDLEKFCILLPSKAKQESISTFLTAIESKIANEEMLQNYFQEEKLYLLRQMFI